MSKTRDSAPLPGVNHPTPYGAGRLTSQRRAIARAAESMPGAFTVEALHGTVVLHRPETGLATVYRAVAAMESTGFLERVGESEQGTLYARCSAEEHHHHLVCTGCGAVAHADCPLDERAEADARAGGFTITSHEMTLYGLCAACSRSVDRER